MAATLLRASVAHVPRDPFREEGGLELHEDGALLLAGGRVLAAGPYDALRRADPGAEVRDERGAWVLPGLVDAHVHFPQLGVIGAMGMDLLAWLERRALPAEEAFADAEHARAEARVFLRRLAANGTTSALVFGAHYAPAMHAFFEEAERTGLRVTAGLTLGDRLLTESLHTTPERAGRESAALADRWHGRGRLRYALTPRFSLSCTEELLAVCGELVAARPELWVTSHLNESRREIETVRELFPWAEDYLATYERYGLVRERSVYAHDVHPTDAELGRLAAAGAAVCHCPSSNQFIGSGLFPLRRHLHAGVRVCLGSDVGGGSGFSLLKEALLAYQTQMLLGDEGEALDPARLLWLATRGGALALGLEEVGDFAPGRAADLVLLRPPVDGTLARVLERAPSPQAALAAIVTLAREECVAETWVAGEVVHRREAARPAAR